MPQEGIGKKDRFRGFIFSSFAFFIFFCHLSHVYPLCIYLHRFLQEDCNFIAVDWGNSAKKINYIVSAGDTALVGRQLSLLVQRLLAAYPETLKPSDVHIIGASLGAHVGGFCGRHFQKTAGKTIGRISGTTTIAVQHVNIITISLLVLFFCAAWRYLRP